MGREVIDVIIGRGHSKIGVSLWIITIIIRGLSARYQAYSGKQVDVGYFRLVEQTVGLRNSIRHSVNKPVYLRGGRVGNIDFAVFVFAESSDRQPRVEQH